mmetsp:Transcript_1902/g.7481  ORF Transcript_1902/g.7481 Transcript_1902/m.7481 type:complete len:301 (-) Transcript_1902:101-1003(-)
MASIHGASAHRLFASESPPRTWIPHSKPRSDATSWAVAASWSPPAVRAHGAALTRSSTDTLMPCCLSPKALAARAGAPASASDAPRAADGITEPGSWASASIARTAAASMPSPSSKPEASAARISTRTVARSGTVLCVAPASILPTLTVTGAGPWPESHEELVALATASFARSAKMANRAAARAALRPVWCAFPAWAARPARWTRHTSMPRRSRTTSMAGPPASEPASEGPILEARAGPPLRFASMGTAGPAALESENCGKAAEAAPAPASASLRSLASPHWPACSNAGAAHLGTSPPGP